MTKTLIIDGKTIEVDDDLTVFQACELAGSEIPRFCYHERLSIAGNCRMCLVEISGAPKLIASCAMSVSDMPPSRDGSLQEVKTKTEKVRKAREGVMEFLLINHPLDCPICDQGGECDLQDQAMAFGLGGSRYEENKRAVEEKNIGPLIKTVMTRCIHCTRCVRFMTEIAGVEELGLSGRGEDAEITTYLQRGILSEMSANVVDLCPVGALTHRPWAHAARPWELQKTETIDVMDGVGSAIRVDTRWREVMRILPRNNDVVNEEWISDKTRYVCDGLKSQRLDNPYLRIDGKLRPVSWDEALGAIATRLKSAEPSRVGALAGDLCGAEEMFALKSLMDQLGVKSIDCRAPYEALDPSYGRASYLFNSLIEGIDHADAILLVGTNPRLEAAVLNSRIRGRWTHGGLEVGLVGEPVDLTYAYEDLGRGPKELAEIARGSHPFAEKLRRAQAPMVIVGSGGFTRKDGEAVLGLCAQIAKMACEGSDPAWQAFNVLHAVAGRVAGLDLGFVPSEGGFDTSSLLAKTNSGALEVLYLLGVDEFSGKADSDTFVIYQGSHGDRGAHWADVVLPGSAYTEKSATYVNTEGRVQIGSRAVYPPGEAKEDWKIVRALCEHVGQVLPFNTLSELRSKMYKLVPHFAHVDEVELADQSGVEKLAAVSRSCDSDAFLGGVQDFYFTNPIARSSKIMAQMSELNLRMKNKGTRVAAE